MNMSGAAGTADITIPGVCHHFPIAAVAAGHQWVTGDRAHDGDLIFGDNHACGPMRLHYSTAGQWRALAAEANRIADWLEAS